MMLSSLNNDSNITIGPDAATSHPAKPETSCAHGVESGARDKSVISPPPLQDENEKTGLASLAIAATSKLQNTPSLVLSNGEATCIGEHDVMLGRGGETNHNPGNKSYRALVRQYQMVYIKAKRHEKTKMSQMVVDTIRRRGGRFLKKQADGTWEDVGNSKAREKTSQTFREGAPELRKEARGPRIKLLKARVRTSLPSSRPPVMPPPKEYLLLEHFRQCNQPSCQACVPVREALKIFYGSSMKSMEEVNPMPEPREGICSTFMSTYTGCVTFPTAADVVCGKGKPIQDHIGNQRFRYVVKKYQEMYHEAPSRAAKTDISKHIVQEIRAFGGRFLQWDPSIGAYHDVGDEFARHKVSHALRA